MYIYTYIYIYIYIHIYICMYNSQTTPDLPRNGYSLPSPPTNSLKIPRNLRRISERSPAISRRMRVSRG